MHVKMLTFVSIITPFICHLRYLLTSLVRKMNLVLRKDLVFLFLLYSPPPNPPHVWHSYISCEALRVQTHISVFHCISVEMINSDMVCRAKIPHHLGYNYFIFHPSKTSKMNLNYIITLRLYVKQQSEGHKRLFCIFLCLITYIHDFISSSRRTFSP